MRTVNDNDELAYRAKLLMVRMCGVIIPRQFINPILDELFSAIQTFPVSATRMRLAIYLTLSKSWKVRLKILPLVQGSSMLCIRFFHQHLSDIRSVLLPSVRFDQ